MIWLALSVLAAVLLVGAVGAFILLRAQRSKGDKAEAKPRAHPGESASKWTAIVSFLGLVVSATGLVLTASSSHTTPPLPTTDLQVASVRVHDPTVSVPIPTLDIQLRNTGSQVAVLTALELSIREFASLEICEAGGELTPTGTYEITLPVPAAANTRSSTPISQELPPNTADRFQAEVGLAALDPGDQGNYAYFVYVVDIALSHDGKQEPVPAGRPS